MIALIITVIIVSVLAVLLFPITISFNSVRSGETIEGSLGISWIIFLFRYALEEKQLDILIFERRIFSSKSPEKKPTEMESVKERKLKRKRRIPIRDLNIIGPLLRLLKDLVNSFRLKYCDINITFGHSDPFYTGILTGFTHTVCGSFGIGQNFRFTPDFTGTALDWNLRAKASITPIKIILPFVNFATNRKVLRLALQNLTLYSK